MTQIVENALKKQFITLQRLYVGMLVFIVGSFVTTFFFDPIDPFFLVQNTFPWLELSLTVMGIVVLGVALPLVYKRLTRIDTVQAAGEKLLLEWGLPDSVDPVVGRQAVYLTRYSAGCILSWTMAASVGLYGLVTKVLGSHAIWTTAFFLFSLLAMIPIRPQLEKTRKELSKLT